MTSPPPTTGLVKRCHARCPIRADVVGQLAGGSSASSSASSTVGAACRRPDRLLSDQPAGNGWSPLERSGRGLLIHAGGKSSLAPERAPGPARTTVRRRAPPTLARGGVVVPNGCTWHQGRRVPDLLFVRCAITRPVSPGDEHWRNLWRLGPRSRSRWRKSGCET
jgi:hypothetical protein